jgi:hypothetical protein
MDMDNRHRHRHLFSRRKYSNITNPNLKERVEAHGFGLTSGRSPRRASASILDTYDDVVEDGRDSPEAIIGVYVSNFMRLY